MDEMAHQAGEVISRFEQRFNQHFDKLPTSREALKSIGNLSDDELALCLENTYRRTVVTAPGNEWSCLKKAKPVVCPSATAAAIDNWRENWRQPKVRSTEKCRL